MTTEEKLRIKIIENYHNLPYEEALDKEAITGDCIVCGATNSVFPKGFPIIKIGRVLSTGKFCCQMSTKSNYIEIGNSSGTIVVDWKLDVELANQTEETKEKLLELFNKKYNG